MDELAGDACLVGVKTGPSPGATGFRGVVGCDRGTVEGAPVPADELVAGSALGGCTRASLPGVPGSDGAPGEPLTGVLADGCGALHDEPEGTRAT